MVIGWSEHIFPFGMKWHKKWTEHGMKCLGPDQKWVCNFSSSKFEPPRNIVWLKNNAATLNYYYPI